jgi:glycosyltransferase involved in cell wall biosynthesis
MKTAVVVPCYNVEFHIKDVVDSIHGLVDVIIAVDDASKDDTNSKLNQLAQRYENVKVISHKTNQGVGAAMKTGYKLAMELQCTVIIKMDGDGQMDSKYLPTLISKVASTEADFAKGNRFHDLKALKAMPISRRLGNLGLSFLIKAASGYWNIFDPSNGFTAISNNALSRVDMTKIHDRYFYESSMLIELYYSNSIISDVPMEAKYGDEISGLSISKTLIEFPPKLVYAMIKRILLKYFLLDFNIASLYMLVGFPLFISGSIFGIVNFIYYGKNSLPAPTGTVVIPTLFIILGFQLLLAALSYDVSNFPRKNKH